MFASTLATLGVSPAERGEPTGTPHTSPVQSDLGWYVDSVTDQNNTKWNRWLFVALSAVWALTFVYDGTPLNETTWCLWRTLTELNCAGCGLTRSFCAMSDGELLAAAQQHPAGPLLYGGMVVAWMQTGMRWQRGDVSVLRLPGRLLQGYWVTVVTVFAVHLVQTLSGWSDLTY